MPCDVAPQFIRESLDAIQREQASRLEAVRAAVGKVTQPTTYNAWRGFSIRCSCLVPARAMTLTCVLTMPDVALQSLRALMRESSKKVVLAVLYAVTKPMYKAYKSAITVRRACR
jgi:hypothetical protein